MLGRGGLLEDQGKHRAFPSSLPSNRQFGRERLGLRQDVKQNRGASIFDVALRAKRASPLANWQNNFCSDSDARAVRGLVRALLLSSRHLRIGPFPHGLQRAPGSRKGDMSTIIGLVVVFVAVLGGFAMAGGAFGILVQPASWS